MQGKPSIILGALVVIAAASALYCVAAFAAGIASRRSSALRRGLARRGCRGLGSNETTMCALERHVPGAHGGCEGGSGRRSGPTGNASASGGERGVETEVGHVAQIDPGFLRSFEPPQEPNAIHKVFWPSSALRSDGRAARFVIAR